MNKYYQKYLHSVAKALNPELDEESLNLLLKETVHYTARKYKSKRNIYYPEIDSKLAFFTLYKLVVNTLNKNSIKFIYLHKDDRHMQEIVQKFNVKEIMADVKKNGLFNTNDKTKVFTEDLIYKNTLSFGKVSKKKGRKREIKCKAKEEKKEDQKPLFPESIIRKYQEEERIKKTKKDNGIIFKRRPLLLEEGRVLKRQKEIETPKTLSIDDISSNSDDEETQNFNKGLYESVQDTRYLN